MHSLWIFVLAAASLHAQQAPYDAVLPMRRVGSRRNPMAGPDDVSRAFAHHLLNCNTRAHQLYVDVAVGQT